MNSNIIIKRRKIDKKPDQKNLSDLIEVKEFNREDENLILNYTIMDDEFSRFIYNKYEQGQIKTKYFTPHLQTVFRWIMKYTGEYKKAPKKTMQSLYENHSKSLSDEKKEVIAIYLERLSEEFVKQDENGVDIEWLKKEIVPKFVLRREGEQKYFDIKTALDHNDFKRLEKALSSYNIIEDEIGTNIVGMTSVDIGKECSKKIRFIWRDYFPKGQMSLITARGGSGKTCFAVQICKEIMEKRPKSIIVWVYCDRQISDLKTKLDASFGGEAKVPKSILTAKRDKTYLWNFKYQGQIDDLSRYLSDIEKEHDRKVSIVFIDSLSSVTQGVKENTDEIAVPMRKLMAVICSNGKTACVIIHHDNKKNVFRGFTGIQDIPVCHLSMKDTELDNVKEVHIVKLNLPTGRKGHILNTVKINKDKIKIVELSESVKQNNQSAKSMASELMVGLFAECTKWPQKEIEHRASIKDKRITYDVLKKVKYKLGIKSIKEGKDWYWYSEDYIEK